MDKDQFLLLLPGLMGYFITVHHHRTGQVFSGKITAINMAYGAPYIMLNEKLFINLDLYVIAHIRES